MAAYLGYKSGAAKKALSLVSFLASAFIAGRASSSLGRWLVSSGIAPAASAQLIAFFLVLCVVLVALFFLFRRLSALPLFRSSSQVIGLILGLLEGLFLLSALLWVLKAFDEPGSKLRSQSALYRPVSTVAPAVVDLAKNTVPGASELRHMFDTAVTGDEKR